MEKGGRPKLKREARALIRKDFLALFAANFIYDGILGLCYLIKDNAILLSVALALAFMLDYGVAAFYLNYLNKSELSYWKLLISYKSFKRFIKHLAAYIIKYVIILFSAAFLIIPGIMKRYSYSQVRYVMGDAPDSGILECLLKSKRMMRWHRLELLIIDLTFIPFYLLAPFTGGLLFIYLTPYYAATTAKFYVYVKERYELNLDIDRSIAAHIYGNFLRMTGVRG